MGTGPFVIPGRRFACALAASAAVFFVATSARAEKPTTDPQQNARALAAIESSNTDSDDTLQLTGLQDKFEQLAQRVAPSVVSISASTDKIDATDTLKADHLNPEKLQNLLERTTRMVGTGFFIDSDGYILTNEHVIGEAENIWVTTDDRKVYPAIVVGSDPRSDLAILKIPATNTKPVHFAAYNSVKRGEWSIAMGNPYGLATEGASCMSVGVVSAVDRSLTKLARKENRLYAGLIQTTAQINPGNSGGPLFDVNGDLIGINTAVVMPEKNTNGIGFAIPVTPRLISVMHALRDGREVVYGFLGINASTPSDSDRHDAGLLDTVGVRVDSVETDSPAAKAGLKESDMIVQINGEVIRETDQFVSVIGDTPIDLPADISIYRDGKPQKVSVQLRKRQLPSMAVTRESRRFRWEGLLLGPIPANWSFTGQRPKSGLMVLAVGSSTFFGKVKLAEGDIITAVGGKQINDITELQKIVNDLPAEKCVLTIVGHDKPTATVAATN